MNNRYAGKITVNSYQLAKISFVLFFARDCLLTLTKLVLPGLATAISVSLVYGFAGLACLLNYKKYLKLDFLILYIGVIIFFLLTTLFHPEYAPYYNRSGYGVWDYVFNPFKGIYAYFFVRLIEDEKDFLKLLRKVGYLMMLYFLYTYYLSTARGYWYGVGMGSGRGNIEMSYSVSFGYNVLPFTLLFLNFTFKEKKMMDLIAAVTGIVLILIAGSRGPILFIGTFLILYIINLPASNRKWIIIFAIASISLLLYIFYDNFVLTLINLLAQFGLSSRFLTKLLEGTITSDSGRSYLWNVALEMIRENPFGYGFMGSRHIIGNIMDAGYPHSIILELLVDFGVIIGSFFVAAIVIGSAKILFGKKENCWKEAYVVFFSSACSLLISFTFWSTPSLWICLGIAVNRHFSIKKQKQNCALNRNSK